MLKTLGLKSGPAERGGSANIGDAGCPSGRCEADVEADVGDR